MNKTDEAPGDDETANAPADDGPAGAPSVDRPVGSLAAAAAAEERSF